MAVLGDEDMADAYYNANFGRYGGRQAKKPD
jgi:hypothetical protein